MSNNQNNTQAMRGHIEQLAGGYMLSFVLFSAVELGLFKYLAEGSLDTLSLAKTTGASVSGIARLCGALCALGLLQRDEGGCFSAPEAVLASLDERRDGSLVPVLRYHQTLLSPLMARLTGAVRTALPQHAAWSFASPDAVNRHAYEELRRHPEEYALFLQAMDLFSHGVGTEIAKMVDLSAARRLVDLGGGSGRIAREILLAVPGLQLEMVDVPLACEQARREASALGLDARFRATPADLLALPSSIEPADVVLLSAILADWSPADRTQILAGAAALLRPGGLLLVSETLLAEDRTGPATPAILSLVMLVAMQGDGFTLSEISSILRGAGFTSIQHCAPYREGSRDLLIAKKE
jgi:hypothetical protein